MSEQTSTAVAGEQNEQVQEQAKEFAAITSQEDFDTRIQARIARERGRFADYDDLKASAAKLAEIEAANQTESEKVAERLAAAEKRAVELEAKAARAEVAAAKGVPAALLSGSTQEELEASADALIAFKGITPEPEAKTDKKTFYVADEGGVPALGKQDNISPGMGSLRAGYAQEKE
jgi:hypothetical protein